MLNASPCFKTQCAIFQAELALKGAPINDQSITRAARLAAEESQPRDSALRGGADYRRVMLEVMLKRAVKKATERAQ